MAAELSSELEPLYGAEEWLQIAVAAAMVARMQPNYQLFCEVSGSQGAQAFTNLLALVWEFASGANSTIDFDKQLEKLETITPDPADFDMYGVWPALDATVAMASLLGCCERFDQVEIEAIMELSRATIDGFVQASGALSEQVRDEHELFAMEDGFIESLLECLSSVGSRAQRVAAIRALAAEVGVSNIGLELD